MLHLVVSRAPELYLYSGGELFIFAIGRKRLVETEYRGYIEVEFLAR
jgi:hypothetical protein